MESKLVHWLCPVLVFIVSTGVSAGQEGGTRSEITLAWPARPAAPQVWGLADLVSLSLAQNPTLAQAGMEIDAARGQVRQAGLYPNPALTITGDEMGKEGGIITAPLLSQEIVTGGKRRLNIAIAARKYDSATLALVKQRYVLIGTVRQGFFEVLTVQHRVATLQNLELTAKNSYETTKRMLEAKQVAVLDLLQVQVELNRVQSDLETAKREQTAAWRRLIAGSGLPYLEERPLLGSFEAPLPEYDFEACKAILLENHPEVGMARVGINQAELTLRRAEVEKIPNVTIGAGYVRNNNDKADQWMFQVGMPIPVFNRNQGNVMTARAEVSKSMQEVARVQNDLLSRLATSFGNYSAAKERVQRYRTLILPIALQASKIALDAYKGGQFEYLRVLQSQRTLQEANLEYVRTLGEAWRAASEISGLLLEEEMPLGPPAKAK